MGLDVWFREDVARALRAAQVAGREAQTGMESEGSAHPAGASSPSGEGQGCLVVRWPLIGVAMRRPWLLLVLPSV